MPKFNDSNTPSSSFVSFPRRNNALNHPPYMNSNGLTLRSIQINRYSNPNPNHHYYHHRQLNSPNEDGLVSERPPPLPRVMPAMTTVTRQRPGTMRIIPRNRVQHNAIDVTTTTTSNDDDDDDQHHPIHVVDHNNNNNNVVRLRREMIVSLLQEALDISSSVVIVSNDESIHQK